MQTAQQLPNTANDPVSALNGASPVIDATRRVTQKDAALELNNRIETVAMNAVLCVMEMVGQQRAGGVDIQVYRMIEKGLKRVAERDHAKNLDAAFLDPDPNENRPDSDKRVAAAEKALSEDPKN